MQIIAKSIEYLGELVTVIRGSFALDSDIL